MPNLAESASVAVVAGADSTLAVQSPDGFARVSDAAGVALWEGRSTTLDMQAGSQVTILAVRNALYYELTPDAAATNLTATQAGALAATGSASPAPGQAWIVAGDSYAANGIVLTASNRFMTDQSVMMWASRLLKRRVFELDTRGVSGEVSTALRARFMADVVNNPKGRAYGVLVISGLNDIYSATPVAPEVTIQNIDAMYRMARDAGMLFAYMIQQPESGTILASADWTAAKLQNQLRLRELVISWAKLNPNVLLVDAFAQAIDPVSATGDIKSALYSYNNGAGDIGVHASNYSAYYSGKSLAALLDSRVPTLPESNVAMVDNWTTNNAASNLLDNTLFTTATGGTLNGTVTGAAPAGVTVSQAAGTPTVAASVVARSDGRGNDLQLVITAGAANDSVRVALPDLIARLVNGDTTWFEAEVSATNVAGSNLRGVVLYWAYSCGGTSYNTREGGANVAANTKALPENFTLSCRTYPLTAPPAGAFSGTAIPTIDIQFSAAGTAVTVKIGLTKVRRRKAP